MVDIKSRIALTQSVLSIWLGLCVFSLFSPLFSNPTYSSIAQH